MEQIRITGQISRDFREEITTSEVADLLRHGGYVPPRGGTISSVSIREMERTSSGFPRCRRVGRSLIWDRNEVLAWLSMWRRVHGPQKDLLTTTEVMRLAADPMTTRATALNRLRRIATPTRFGSRYVWGMDVPRLYQDTYMVGRHGRPAPRSRRRSTAHHM